LVEGGRDRAWSWSQSSYRTLLFGVGTKEKCEANSLSVSQLREVIAEGGTLSLATVLRCRVRFFTDGAVLGSREFVNSFLPCPEDSSPQQKPPKSKPLPQSTDWGPLFVLRRLRGQTFG
jgi:putative transposase